MGAETSVLPKQSGTKAGTGAAESTVSVWLLPSVGHGAQEEHHKRLCAWIHMCGAEDLRTDTKQQMKRVMAAHTCHPKKTDFEGSLGCRVRGLILKSKPQQKG